MAKPDPGSQGPGGPPAQPRHGRRIALPVKLAHHPVVLAEEQRRAADLQLRIADGITAFAGSMNFVYLHVALFTAWMLFIESKPWPTLTLIVSLEAIFLSTFVMLSQNREAARSDLRSEIDFETNVLSEVWLEAVADSLGIDVARVYNVANDRIRRAKAQQDHTAGNPA
jgi:uncharacterized membrane protein